MPMTKLFGTTGSGVKRASFRLMRKQLARSALRLPKFSPSGWAARPRFVSGRDTRESGWEIEFSFHGGAASGGAVGESAGVITTPGVAFLTKEFEFDAGIVISASHNPFPGQWHKDLSSFRTEA
jgi:phosphoglucosamine mutase